MVWAAEANVRRFHDCGGFVGPAVNRTRWDLLRIGVVVSTTSARKRRMVLRMQALQASIEGNMVEGNGVDAINDCNEKKYGNKNCRRFT